MNHESVIDRLGQTGISDADLRDRFMQAYPIYLALALHKRFGFQIEATIQIESRYQDAHIAHAWVVDGDTAIDARGHGDADVARREFDGTFTRAMSADDLVWWHTPSRVSPVLLAEAVKAVDQFFVAHATLGAK